MKCLHVAGFGMILSLALAGCDAGPAGPSEVVEPGTLSFAYTGGLPEQLDGGSFRAEGAPVLDARGRPGAGEWAVAAPHPLQAELVPAGSKLAVLGFVPGGSEEGALFVLTLPRVTAPATVEISDACTEVGCARALVLLGVGPREPHEGVEGSCTVGEGVVEITSVEGGRVRGTFSGRGRCAVDWRSGPSFDFAVEQGRFEVPVAETLRSGLRIWS